MRHPSPMPPQPFTRSAPDPLDGVCTPDPPHYLRIAKTGSTSAMDFIRRSNCIQRGHLKRSMEFHGEIPEEEMRQGQRTVVVLREPCARARSTLEWWPRVTLPTHPAHNLSTLREFASFAAELPRRYPRAWNGTTYQRIIALAWEQSRYVNKCTTVLCLGPELEAAFQLLCHSSLPLAHLNNASTVVAAQGPHSQSAEPTEAECAPIRRLYETDDSLWRTHCGSQAYAWAGRLLDRFEPGLAALGASPGRGRV